MNWLGWIKGNRLSFVVLVLILNVAGFARLYRIDQYMTFLGDEGRDVLTVSRFLRFGDLMFVGPGTSVGNMYLGPFYYYYMAPWLLAWNYSPVGPAVGIAALGVVTVGFLWYVVKLWTKSSLLASLSAVLYALSPTVIIYSRSSWNPNIMPFFALLTIFALWKVWEQKHRAWLVVVFLSFGITLQSHYLALLLTPTIAVVWFLAFREILKMNRGRLSKFLWPTFGGGLLFVLLATPLILFDAKHHWRNLSAMWEFLGKSDSDFKFRLFPFITHFWQVWEKLNIRLLAGTNVLVGKLLSIAFPIILIFGIRKESFFRKKYLQLTLLWIFFGLLGLALYKGEVYDHYLGFVFPSLFILLALVFEIFKHVKANFLLKVIYWLLVGILLFVSLMNNPLRKYPNRLLERSMMVARKIVEESGGQRFNFALIGDKNYEPNYQYFLEIWNTPVVEIDPQRYEQTLAEQLFVVCEYPKEKCQPTSNPKAQVANFGWSKIDASWDIEGVTLYKLVSNK